MMSTVRYQPTHQPNAPDHISLPWLATAKAAQREKDKATQQRSAHRKIKERQTGGDGE